MLQKLTLGGRFTLLIFVLVLGVTLLLGTFVSMEASRLLRQSIFESTSENAFQMADKLDRQMAAHVQEVQLLRQVLPFTLASSPDQVRSQLEQLQKGYEVASWIGFTDPEGTVIAATDGILEGVSIAHRPVFLNGREDLWLGDVHEALLLAQLLPNPTGEPIKFVDIAAPVTGADGNLQGVLAVHLSWEWARRIMQSMFPRMELRSGMELFVVGDTGTVLLGPASMLGESVALPDLRNGAPEPGEEWTLRNWADGLYVTGYAESDGMGDFTGLGWTVLSRRPAAVAFAPVRSLQRGIAMIGIVLAIVFAVLGLLIAQRISRPLQRLADAADLVDSRQSSDAIPLQRSSPELYRLSLSMRKMVSRLQDQYQAIDHLESMAHKDALTGLPNRTFLKSFLTHARVEMEREERALALIFMDLDGFKAVNDNLGHQAGDEVLQVVATRLQEQLRSGDIAVRLGGDEFVLALKADRANAYWLMTHMAERLLPAIAEPMTLPSGHCAKVTTSMGAAWWPDHGDNMPRVMEHADQALYQAKAEGRNRLVVFSLAE